MSQAGGRVMTREGMQALLEKAIKLSKADRVSASLNSSWRANTRFAANQMSTAGAIENASLGVSSWFGNRRAGVSSNDLSDEGIARTVSQSEALAKIAPADPEDMPALPKQTYTPVQAFFETTANCTAEERARAALTALSVTRKAADLDAAGYIELNAGANALMNSAGLFAYHMSTSANYTLTVRTKDGTGSGWAGSDNPDWSRLNFAEVSNTAIEKARASRNPVAIEPGRYTVVLEPQAVGDLVQLVGGALAARSADEGRSAFTKEGGGNKIGEKIVDERVTIFTDPADPELRSQPFDGEGFPLKRRMWVENGILKQLAYTRFWAQKQGKEPTGGGGFGGGGGIKFTGGTTSLDDMIKSTERGVLVTRLWYLRQVDPRTILYTGLTRDGTFLIEGGKVTKSLRNFRFNESPLFILNNLEALGPARRLAGTEQGGDIVMPALKVRDFNFTSLSEAV